jgi:hypothetical protein
LADKPENSCFGLFVHAVDFWINGMAERFPKTVPGILNVQLEFDKRKESNLHTFVDHFMNKYNSTGLYQTISKISFGHLGRFQHQALFNEMMHLVCNYEKPPVEFPVDCLVGKYARPVLYYIAGWTLYSASKALTVSKDKRPTYYRFAAMQCIIESNAMIMGLPTSIVERRDESRWCIAHNNILSLFALLRVFIWPICH